MKYWIYQDNQVKGPFDRAQIGQLKNFEADTLVCPEGRKGTDMGDWQRASALPELTLLLPSGSVATQAHSGEDPVLRDAVAELKRKFSDFESQLEQVQKELRDRPQPAGEAAPTAEVLAKLEEVDDKLVALSSLDAEVRKLRERIEALEVAPKPAPESAPAPAAAPVPAPTLSAPPAVPEIPVVSVASNKTPSFEPAEFKVETFEKVHLTAPPIESAIAPAPFSAPAPAPIPLPEPAPIPVPEPAPSLTPLPSNFSPPPSFPPAPALQSDYSVPTPAPFSPFSPMESSLPVGGRLEEPPKPVTGAVDLAPSDAPVKRGGSAGKKAAIVVLVVIFALGLALVGSLYMESKKALKTDLVPGLEENAPEAPVAPKNLGGTPGGPSRKSKGEPAQGGELPSADFSQSSVDLVKGYVAPGGQASLGDQLDKSFPSNGGLSPWMVEPLGADRYQVTFYVGTRPLYVFKVQPKARLVEGVNEAAVGLINGEAPKARRPAAPAKKPRRGAVKKKAAAKSDTMIVAPGSDKGKDGSNASLDSLLGQ